MRTLLKLERPLAVTDLETTGTSPGLDRIVEIAVLKIYPDGKITKYRTLVNPVMRIPPEASQIHGITDKDVRGKPSFRKIARTVRRMMENCDLAGYNLLSFDLPFLLKEFKRVGVGFSLEGRSIVDAYKIFQLKEPRDLKAAYRKYCLAEHTKVHSALGDARACWEVIQGQLRYYQDLPRNIEGLHEFCNLEQQRYVDSERKFMWRHNQPAFAFGKHRGRLLGDIVREEPDYLEWILTKDDFSDETKQIVRDALRGNSTRPEE